MINLAELAALYADHGADLDRPVEPVRVTDDLVVGDGDVVVMGVVNLSQDSTYRESVAPSVEAAVRSARTQVGQGADIVDFGAEASHDGADRADAATQIDRLVPVVEQLAGEITVSVETYRPEVAEAVLDAGAVLINLTGREHEDEILPLVARADATVLMCFSPGDNVRDSGELPDDDSMFPALIEHFEKRLAKAREAGVRKVIVDPGSGFTYDNLDGIGKARVQTQVLAQTMRLRRLGVPSAHALPHCFDLFEREFRHAEGFFAVPAALGGSHLLRVHEVPRVRAVLRALRELDVR